MKAVSPDIRLLMVDDEAEFLEAVKPGLGRRGFDVTTAASGRQALEVLASHSFDVVVLDVKLPGLDGVELLRQIRRTSPDVPVILLTGHGSLGQAFESSREGLDQYLTKPCDTITLARVLRDAVERNAARWHGNEETAEMRLLVVDDDEEFAASLGSALARRGIVASAVSDPREALELARERTFDVATLDIALSGTDGLTLLGRLREEDPLLEVIILTGRPRFGDVQRGFKEGAFDYVAKPCDVESLARLIRSARRRRKDREAEAGESGGA